MFSLAAKRAVARQQQQRLFRHYATSRTLVEKIAEQYKTSADDTVRPGYIVSIQPQHVMTHDNTSAVMKKFEQFFAQGLAGSVVKNKQQPVFCLDHNIQDTTEGNLKKYKAIESFAKSKGIDFYPAGRGIGHQVMVEEGYAWPQTLVVGSDSHSNMYGGVGCLGTPVVRTDAASIWATGKTWWQVPKIAKVELQGQLLPGVSGKDVIITLCGMFNKDEVLNYAVEFAGSGVASLSIDERLTIANMTTEWGALAGVFPVDEKTIAWYEQRAKEKPNARINEQTVAQLKKNRFTADSNAKYDKYLTLDLSTVRPYISGPNHVKVMQSVSEAEQKQIKIHKAYIVSCVNSRVNDLAEAARVIKGKKVAPGVELYIAAASSQVQKESEALGDWKSLTDAGAKVLPPGCGPCIGLGTGLLQDGEVGISATNRNFKGRMGSSKAQAYLASPAVVAASAVNGYICAPEALRTVTTTTPVGTVYEPPQAEEVSTSVTSLVDGFPSKIQGQLIFCHQDNMNTDGIYPGKYTYDENIPPSKQAQVAMENYDPAFTKLVTSGDILVGGFNFGTGSSREQAATCLKYMGIPVLIAGSFSETYKRNATNNGFLSIEVPKLVTYLKEKFGTKDLTKPTGLRATIDFVNSKIVLDDKTSFAFLPLGKVAQELILQGGLEQWVQAMLKKE